MITDESKWNSITRGTRCKENDRYKCNTRKAKTQIHNKHVGKNRPRLGQGRAGIRHKKPQPVADISASTNKSHKIPMIQNVTKHRTYFPVPEQLITDKTEAITRTMIHDKNRELPFYPICRPPPKLPENV